MWQGYIIVIHKYTDKDSKGIEKSMKIDLKQFDVWFVTGSQHLYGPETLEKVAAHSREIAQALSHSAKTPVNVVFKPVQTSPEAIRELCLEANAAKNCVGLITWMHTFSPAKMWIAGLTSLQKPFAHLHTQYNREIPWSEIDMDFMNLNQSAHGDREFGFIGSRLRLNRKVIVGHWQDEDVQASLGTWARAACALGSQKGIPMARYSAMAADSAARACSRCPVVAYSMPRLRWQCATSGRMPSSSAKARACW